MTKRIHNSFYAVLKVPGWCLIVSLNLLCNQQHQNKNIFHYNESSGIATLDPAFAKSQSVMWAVHQLYNTLVEIDSNLRIVPPLARSWDISADNLVFTFHLRPDVFFHDNEAFPGGRGRKLVANDVVY